MAGFILPKRLIIQGGNPINGSIEIAGAKNAVLGLMAAAILTDKPVVLTNVPFITDVLDMGHIIQELGAEVQHDPQRKILRIHAQKISKNRLPDRAKKFRASYYLWGALLARFAITKEFNELRVPLPGGCSIAKGVRKFDYHEELLKLNLDVTIDTNADNPASPEFVFTLPEGNPRNDLKFFTTARPSHGATMHWLLACVGNGDAMLYNSALEPEVRPLVDMLNKMGKGRFYISGAGQTGFVKRQLKEKHELLDGGNFHLMPDRLETGSYALLALMTRGQVTLNNIDTEHMTPFLNQLERMTLSSVFFSSERRAMHVSFNKKTSYAGQVMQMAPFPGPETDLQQLWAMVLATAHSPSDIVDRIWVGRSVHVPEMNKFGMDGSYKLIKCRISDTQEEDVLHIHIPGNATLRPAVVKGEDLRGTAGLIMMAAGIEGESIIENPQFALRGYPNMVENLQSVGVSVWAEGIDSELELLPPLQEGLL